MSNFWLQNDLKAKSLTTNYTNFANYTIFIALKSEGMIKGIQALKAVGLALTVARYDSDGRSPSKTFRNIKS